MSQSIRRAPPSAHRRRAAFAALLTAALAVAAGGVWYVGRAGQTMPAGVTRDRYGDLVQTVRAGGVPAFARRRGADVSEVYRFAASEDGKILEWMPCYCGCGGIGHQHNRHCYIKRAAAGTVTFTSHGAG